MLTVRERHAGGKASWGWAAEGAANIHNKVRMLYCVRRRRVSQSAILLESDVSARGGTLVFTLRAACQRFFHTRERQSAIWRGDLLIKIQGPKPETLIFPRSRSLNSSPRCRVAPLILINATIRPKFGGSSRTSDPRTFLEQSRGRVKHTIKPYPTLYFRE